MTVSDWVTILAILLGPVFGVVLAFTLERRKIRRERKLDIFRNLMRTRRDPILPEHVGSLNLVEIEFHDRPKIIGAWKNLFQHLGQPQARHPLEEIKENMNDEEKSQRENKFAERLHRERTKLLSLLLHEIGRDLGYKIEQLEIFEGGYSPQGWADSEAQNRIFRHFMTQIALGQRMFPIGVFYFPPQESDSNIQPGTKESAQD